LRHRRASVTEKGKEGTLGAGEEKKAGQSRKGGKGGSPLPEKEGSHSALLRKDEERSARATGRKKGREISPTPPIKRGSFTIRQKEAIVCRRGSPHQKGKIDVNGPTWERSISRENSSHPGNSATDKTIYTGEKSRPLLFSVTGGKKKKKGKKKPPSNSIPLQFRRKK